MTHHRLRRQCSALTSNRLGPEIVFKGLRQHRLRDPGNSQYRTSKKKEDSPDSKRTSFDFPGATKPSSDKAFELVYYSDRLSECSSAFECNPSGSKEFRSRDLLKIHLRKPTLISRMERSLTLRLWRPCFWDTRLPLELFIIGQGRIERR